EAFHASIQLDRAPDEESVQQLCDQVRKRVAQERELLIDPAFFSALNGHLPQLRTAEVHLKRGRRHNEMTAFRYDVILRVGEDELPTRSPTWLQYDNGGEDHARPPPAAPG